LASKRPYDSTHRNKQSKDMSDKPLAKSLHTVSVLVQVALYVLQSNGATNNKAAIDAAIAILGLSDKPDVYDLKGAALKQLNRI
jgi:hypothetical protein